MGGKTRGSKFQELADALPVLDSLEKLLLERNKIGVMGAQVDGWVDPGVFLNKDSTDVEDLQRSDMEKTSKVRVMKLWL